jgi:hypothetical protein
VQTGEEIAESGRSFFYRVRKIAKLSRVHLKDRPVGDHFSLNSDIPRKTASVRARGIAFSS